MVPHSPVFLLHQVLNFLTTTLPVNTSSPLHSTQSPSKNSHSRKRHGRNPAHPCRPFLLKVNKGTSLVAQWLRIRLPMQGTWVRALVQEDPICCRTTKPVCHNYWACALEPASHNYWSLHATTTEACVPRARAPNKRSHRTATKNSPRSPQLEKAHAQQQRPNTAINKYINLLKNKNKNGQRTWIDISPKTYRPTDMWKEPQHH